MQIAVFRENHLTIRNQKILGTKERRQRASECLTKPGQDTWTLTNFIIPIRIIYEDVRDTLAKEELIESRFSPDEVRN